LILVSEATGMEGARDLADTMEKEGRDFPVLKVHVTDFPVVIVYVDDLSSPRIS
jgi:hypothetical protein